MAVITITISESPVQIISGIPQNISVTTNIPSTIFYTLDGIDPTFDSDIVVGSIILPTVQTSVVFKAFATNGTDTSAIISQTYQNSILTNTRRPHDRVSGLDISTIRQQNLAPFGSNSPNPNIRYGNTGGEIVDSPGLPNFLDGYDGTATGTAKSGTDKPLTEYTFRYSESDHLGQTGPGIGTLPARIRVRIPAVPDATSNTRSKLFNPKALVIIQDGKEPPTDLNTISLNRPVFSLEHPDSVQNLAQEQLGNTGSFLRSHYNPRDQTITYYFFDNISLRWIISKEPFQQKSDQIFNYSQVVFSSSASGSRHVYEWRPFQSRKLI